MAPASALPEALVKKKVKWAKKAVDKKIIMLYKPLQKEIDALDDCDAKQQKTKADIDRMESELLNQAPKIVEHVSCFFKHKASLTESGNRDISEFLNILLRATERDVREGLSRYEAVEANIKNLKQTYALTQEGIEGKKDLLYASEEEHKTKWATLYKLEDHLEEMECQLEECEKWRNNEYALFHGMSLAIVPEYRGLTIGNLLELMREIIQLVDDDVDFMPGAIKFRMFVVRDLLKRFLGIYEVPL